MKAMTIFNHEQFGNIRTLTDEQGETWFVAKDVTDALGFRDAEKGIRGLDEDERGTTTVSTRGGVQQVSTINESGLYSCILKSRKAAVRKFKRWVTRDVLPSIRKQGQYVMTGVTPNVGSPAESGIHPAKALEVVTDYFQLATQNLPNLSESSKQALMATLTEEVVGIRCLPLPKVEERFWTASELAAEFCISPQRLGKTANQNGMKCDEYGEFRISKSRHSDKQVEQFFYNSKGRTMLARLLGCDLDDAAA